MSPRPPLPLGLYVHLPWCVSKCPYCDFNSHPAPAGGIARDAYLVALLDDFDFAAQGIEGREIVSIFFGGGTPSLFDAAAIGEIIARARRAFRAVPDLEVTLEANPGTVEHGRFGAYRDAGVTRISLGAQSFHDEQLAALGRVHSRDDTYAAVQELADAGFENFNLDLMYALPGQTLAQAVHDVELAVALGPAHVSHYQLTLEPGTVFARRPPELPDDDTAYAMQEACQELLTSAGYAQYEVSAYAPDERRCRHNLNYWNFGDYIGVGAGAHGKRTDVATGTVVRTERVRNPTRYMAAGSREARLEATRTLSPHDLAFEFCLNALRLVEGFGLPAFEARTGLPRSVIGIPLEEARARGLLASAPGDRWVPTPHGRRFLNDLQALFLHESSLETVTEGLASSGAIS